MRAPRCGLLVAGMATTSTTKTATDHEEIRRWVQEHGGMPAAVRGTGDHGDPGVLRIDSPGGAGEEELRHITWDEWFRKFARINADGRRRGPALPRGSG